MERKQERVKLSEITASKVKEVLQKKPLYKHLEEKY